MERILDKGGVKMEGMSKPPMPDNAEETRKCPACGAMINVGLETEKMDCPICGRGLDGARILGASNEDF